MGKIHLIMPMGGGGKRFGSNGFSLPKPLIKLQGRPFFFWAAQSVKKFVDVEDTIFVVLQEHIDKFHIDKRIREYYPDAKIRTIAHVLDGAVLTCCEGVKAIEDGLPILFNDCDHAFISGSFYDYCLKADSSNVDGALLTFLSNSPNYSYVKYDDAGNVSGTVEKVVVSNEAICGAYYFRNKQVFSDAVDKYLGNCTYQEFFVSGVYNVIASNNGNIITFPVSEHITFGTPDEFDLAVNDKRLGALL